jgi:uncharacterized membrane protein
METRLKRHRKKLREAGAVRFSLQLSRTDVETLRRLCREHGKTQREMLGLGIQTADALMAGRLQVAKPHSAAERPQVRAQQVPAPTPPTDSRSESLSALEQPQQTFTPATDAGAGEPWWPENYRQILQQARG